MAFERTDSAPRADRPDDGGPPPRRFGGDRDEGGPPRERRSFGDRRGGMGAPRAESSRCRTPGCIKYHDFFQWNGKYYCLECYETLRNAEREMSATA